MDLNINFDAYWQAIGAEPEFATYKNATREQWAAYPDKQRPIMEWLHKHGPYKGRNPYFFIQDFKIRTSATILREPTNYKGKPLPSDKQVLSAKYKGEWGMYTQEDVDYFKMEVYHETT